MAVQPAAAPELDAVVEALTAFLRANLPDGAEPEVTNLRRSGGGASRENWPFDAVWADNGERSVHRLLMRRDPPADVVETQRVAEFAVLKHLARTGMPSPRVHWLDDTGEQLLRPAMIVERCEGSAHRAVLRPNDPLRLGTEGQSAFAASLADALGQLHVIDANETGVQGVLPDPGPEPALQELEQWEGRLDAAQIEPEPGLRAVAAWLRDNPPPPPARMVVVHGDFRPANVLVHEGKLSVVLDWELVHLGDPLDDLGWYTTTLYTHEHFIPGRWEVEDFLRRYTERTGLEINRRALEFWQIMSAFRLAVIAVTAARNFALGTTDRPQPPSDGLVRRVLAAVLAAEGR
ncbi:phosphotransferase [Pseudofrankia sp. BMG5.36]|nr:phosphotransferase [Pseudofrankia sp. BMG5.36]